MLIDDLVKIILNETTKRKFTYEDAAHLIRLLRIEATLTSTRSTETGTSYYLAYDNRSYTNRTFNDLSSIREFFVDYLKKNITEDIEKYQRSCVSREAELKSLYEALKDQKKLFKFVERISPKS